MKFFKAEVRREGKSLGAWIMQAISTGQDLNIPRAEMEPIFSRYFESAGPKIDKVRERQSPNLESERLKLK